MENNGSRAYGGSNVILVRNESSTDMSLVAMLASCSPVALQVQRSGGGLEDHKRAFYPTFEASGEDPGEEDIGDDCTQHVEKKRRLSFDQVRSLEKNFELENKLEPERKMQLARDLGLQPRQVAVWFQNRRARWKTKQLERDFEVLTSDYNRLKSDYDAVLQEKQDLQVKIDSLTGKLQTAKQNPAPEKSKRQKTEAQVSLQKTSDGSLKLESVPSEMNASNGESTPRKEEGSRAALSSDSISSEIVNSDSPRTMDSGALVPLENISTFPQISGGMVDSSIIPLGDNLCDQMLSPLDCQRVSVKPEDGLYQDDNCNFILPQLHEEKGLPWWDWP